MKMKSGREDYTVITLRIIEKHSDLIAQKKRTANKNRVCK